MLGTKMNRPHKGIKGLKKEKSVKKRLSAKGRGKRVAYFKKKRAFAKV
jgi:hypothetical protein